VPEPVEAEDADGVEDGAADDGAADGRVVLQQGAGDHALAERQSAGDDAGDTVAQPRGRGLAAGHMQQQHHRGDRDQHERHQRRLVVREDPRLATRVHHVKCFGR
jgi:hypothetical protein